MEAATIRVLFTKFISFIRKRIRSNKSKSQSQTTLTPISVLKPSPPIDESALFHPSLQASMSEIIDATKNFSADLIVGYGSFGLVYRVELPNGLKLAVKKLDPRAFQGFMEFRSEHEILSKLRHRNIARLLGYCISGADRILITEFCEMGDLGNHLHDLSLSSSNQNDMSYSRSPLSWEARYKILIGAAKGLACMHDLDKPIIHRDVRSNNVLLDSDFEAKLSDFGLARIIDFDCSHVTTQSGGPDGYTPPEYATGSKVVTVKGDVYSFGVLMLEVATGRRPTPSSLPEWAKKMITQNRERKMLDPNMWVCRGLEGANIKEYFRIAMMCANESILERPVMRDVVELLTQNFI